VRCATSVLCGAAERVVPEGVAQADQVSLAHSCPVQTHLPPPVTRIPGAVLRDVRPGGGAFTVLRTLLAFAAKQLAPPSVRVAPPPLLNLHRVCDADTTYRTPGQPPAGCSARSHIKSRLCLLETLKPHPTDSETVCHCAQDVEVVTHMHAALRTAGLMPHLRVALAPDVTSDAAARLEVRVKYLSVRHLGLSSSSRASFVCLPSHCIIIAGHRASCGCSAEASCPRTGPALRP